MPTILITPATLAGVDGAFMNVLRSAGFTVKFPPIARQMTEPEMFDLLKGVDAALAGSEPYTRSVLQAAPQLKAIARAGVGYDAVDTSAATDLGKVVMIAPGTNQDA